MRSYGCTPSRRAGAAKPAAKTPRQSLSILGVIKCLRSATKCHSDLRRAAPCRYYTQYDSELHTIMSVRHALLALLSEGPKYGLQLRHEFEERTGEVWPLNVGQVYTTLQRLERDGFIEAEEGDGAGSQKSYRLTAA